MEEGTEGSRDGGKVDVRAGIIVVVGSCKMHACMVACLLAGLDRYSSGTVTSYWSTEKEGCRPQQSGPRTWNSMVASSLRDWRERERELLTSIHSPTESASCLSHSLTLFLSIPSPPLFLSIPSPPLSPSSSYACFCPTTGCCCCCRLVTTITHSLTLRNTRNSAAWTIAIAIPPPNITKTIAAIQQQHHLLSSPQHTDINIDSSITIDIYTQYQYRATRRSLAPLNPCSPLSILLTLSRLHRAPPPATTQALSLSLHIAACPPIVCLLACLT